ncbi:DUF6003 family protein [Streptomyces chrestomyceticus]|uniref:DUF6003 family protein n=1 Tax=Streptomyces chrestomyceticus TaxID=68185 RepID=UPI0035A8F5B4
MDDSHCQPISTGWVPSESVPGPVEGRRQQPALQGGGVEDELRLYGQMKSGRDDLFRRAADAGVSEARIARLTGHSRTTVRAALGTS